MKSKRTPSAAVLCALLAAGALVSPHPARAQNPVPAVSATPAAMTPEQSAAALAGAKGALIGFAASKSLPEAVDHLTDRSVGTLGIVFTLPIAMMIGFSQLTDTTDKPSPDPTLQKDFDDFLTRSLGKDVPKDFAGLPPTLIGHEREFVRGLMEFDAREEKLSKDKSKDDGFQFSKPIPADLQKYKFAVISPTEVRITPTKASTLNLPGVTSVSAMRENGQWRLDLGDPAIILKSLKDSSKSSGEPKTNPLGDKMIDAVKAHDIPQIKALLHKDPKLVDARDFMGESALYNTVFWEDVPTAAFLIAHGAKVNAVNDLGKTPLDEAIFFKRTEMIALLKKHGGKPGLKQKDKSP